ncbi:MAG TPA: PP2C family protein-serine/threonine phosphatase [Mycobacteriales bacterium]|nr:PP2C family protein-serine/threonine phosphatase [Mycobacteriales bacterium]
MFQWSRDEVQLGWLLGTTTVGGVVALALSDTVTLISLFVLPATIAALSLGPIGTLLVAAYASVWALALSIQVHSFTGPGHGSGFATVVAVAAISTVAASRWRRREVTLHRISLVAEAAQATIVRPIPSRLGSLTFATIYRSAAEEARVGGDAYAAVAYPEGVRLLIADVRGKGLEAVGLAADVLASFREFAPGSVTLVDVARHLENAIVPGLGDEDFVTALLVDFTADQIGLVSCGHPWPLLRRGDQVTEIIIDRPSPPLGLGVQPRLQTHPFRPGDQLFVFTDGLIEARNRHGAYFEPISVIRDLPAGESPRETLDRLITSLDEHAGSRLADDLAIVLTEYTADPVTTLVEGVRVLAGESGPVG